jgi:hypothetical protein
MIRKVGRELTLSREDLYAMVVDGLEKRDIPAPDDQSVAVVFKIINDGAVLSWIDEEQIKL